MTRPTIAHISRLPLFAAALLVAAVGAVAVARDNPGNDAEKTKQPDAPLVPITEVPPPPTVRLAPVSGATDDDARRRAMTERAGELERRAGESTEREAKAALLLAAANIRLSNELEPAYSRRILGLDDTDASPDAILAVVDRCDALLESAGAELRTGGDAAEPSDARRTLSYQLSQLTAFASALRAYLIDPDDESGAQDARRAALGLSPLLEEDDRTVSEAATFWQACLRSRESDPGPTLARLDLAVADLPPRSLPYSFFGRLLRCETLAAHGDNATALALLMQIEERCIDWWPDQKQRDDALRAIALKRLRVLRRWHDQLDESTRARERAWCARRMTELIAERFTGGDDPVADDTVARLYPAIPILVSPPAPAIESTAVPNESPE